MNEPSSPIHIRWLVSLRWAAIAAQIASIAGVKFLLRAPFPLAPLVMVVGAMVAATSRSRSCCAAAKASPSPPSR